MKFREWQEKSLALDEEVHQARLVLETAESRRNEFLMETVGFYHTSLATLSGTINMVSKIIEMKKEEEGLPK